MKPNHLIAVGAALALSHGAEAKFFQGEFLPAAGTGEQTTASGTSRDRTSSEVEVVMFLEKFDDSEGPKAEAAFIQKASNVALLYDNVSVDVDSTTDADVTGGTVSGHFVQKSSGVFLDLAYGRRENDDASQEISEVEVGVGKYLRDNITVSFSYGKTKDERIASGVPVELETSVLNGELRFLLPIGSWQGALELDTFISQSDEADDGEEISASYTLYPNHSLGITVGAGFEDQGAAEIVKTSLAAEWFVISDFAVSLTWDYESDGESDYEIYDIKLGARVRF